MGSHGVRTPRFADGVAALVAPPLVAPPPVALLPVVPPLAGIVRSKFPPRVGTQLGWASNPVPAVMCGPLEAVPRADATRSARNAAEDGVATCARAGLAQNDIGRLPSARGRRAASGRVPARRKSSVCVSAMRCDEGEQSESTGEDGRFGHDSQWKDGFVTTTEQEGKRSQGDPRK